MKAPTRAAAIGATLALLACTPGAAHESVSLGHGVSLEIPVGGTPHRTEDEGRTALRLEDGSAITVQRVVAEDRDAPEGRTPTSVAAALVHRVELGERGGELSHRPCRAGGRDAVCVSGWTDVGGERFARDGMILAVGDDIVWVDVAGPESLGREVGERATAVREQMRVVGDM